MLGRNLRKYCSIGDIKLVYYEKGTGDTVLLIHGNSMNSIMMKKMFNYLSQFYHVVAVDSRGHGGSESGKKAYSIELFAEDMVEFCRNKFLNNIIVIGYSDGANVALRIASRYPDLARKMVLISGNYNAHGLKWLIRIPAVFIKLIMEIIKKIFPNTRFTLWKINLLLSNYGITEKELEKINTDILILAAKHDFIYRKHQIEMSRHLKNAHMYVVRATNHINIIVSKRTFNIIKTFIERENLIKNSNVVEQSKKDRIRNYVMKYGQNTISYLAVDNDKQYYFGHKVEGVVAFTVVAHVVVCCGDVICQTSNVKSFLLEFISFCEQNRYSLALIDVSEKFLKIYESMGFEYVKCGEDAMFELSNWNLKGGKIAKVRAAINHANKLGIYVEEYKPLKCRDENVESEIDAITQLWKKGKHGGLLSFILGGAELETPCDRRYFFARDKSGKMLGFVVFIPFEGGNGYLADVTRRIPGAPQGVIETIIYEAFMKIKSEGVKWGSMGLAPLVNVGSNGRASIIEKILKFIYEKLNGIYSFKSLYHSKKKYAPTQWESRYIVYHSRIFTPKIGYAIVRAISPQGILSLIGRRKL